MSRFAELRITFLSASKGGWENAISLSCDTDPKYRPHLRVVGGDREYLGVEFVDGPDDPVMPGETTFATVRFSYMPQICYDALAIGTEIEVMEGSRVVATGLVTRIGSTRVGNAGDEQNDARDRD